jgi:predicted GIY-YIG superfamily endonuclease
VSKILDRPASVYELWAGDQCLYVGCTVNLRSRISDHSRYFYHWAQVTEVRVRDFPTHSQALAAESALIYTLRPPENIRHNPDHDRGLLGVPKRIAQFRARAAAGFPSARVYLAASP